MKRKLDNKLQLYDSPDRWTDCRNNKCECVRCGEIAQGVYYRNGDEICLACALESMTLDMKDIIDVEGLSAVAEIIDDQGMVAEKIGIIKNLDFLLEVSSMKNVPVKNLLPHILEMSGMAGPHPLFVLLRLLTMYTVIQNEEIFLKTIIKRAREIVEENKLPSYNVQLYNLALIVSFIAPYNKWGFALIERALSYAKKNNDHNFLDWFVIKGGYYFPRSDSLKRMNEYELLKNFRIGLRVFSDERERVKRLLDEIYKVPDLKNIYVTFIKDIREINGKRSSLRKIDYITIITDFLSDEKLFSMAWDRAPVWIREAIEKIVWNDDVISYTGLMEKAGLTPAKKKKSNYFYEGPHLPREFSVFTYFYTGSRYGLDGDKVYLSLDSQFSDLLRSSLKKPDEGWLVFRDRCKTGLSMGSNPEILDQLSIVSVYIDQVGLKYSKDGKRILKTSIHSIKKLCTVNELYPGDKKLGTMRLEFLLNMVYIFLETTGDSGSLPPKDLFKHIFTFYFGSEGKNSKENLGWMLDYLDYPFYGMADNKQDLILRERQSIRKLLDQLVVGKWVAIEAVYRYLKENGNLPCPVYFDKKYTDMVSFREIEKEYYSTSNKIQVDSTIAGIVMRIPYLKALFFALNTLGVVSVGYDYPKNTIYRSKSNPWLSVYDGIRDVSLTPLGAWLIGKNDDPGIAENTMPEEIDLDDKRLLIRYRGQRPMVNLLLSRIAYPLNRGSYLITFESFLAVCSSVEDIKREIGFFRSDISENPPRIWETFFEEIIKNADPFTPEADDFYIFSVKKNNRSLIEKLFKDPYLKNHIIKAEDYRLLVKKKYYKSVRARLLELGYFLPQMK